MNMIVFISQVSDTNSEIELNDSKTGIKKITDNLILNPNDEFAVKEAVDLKKKFGGEVVVVSAGPESVQKTLRTCLAKDADRAIHLSADIDNLDSLSLATILAENAKNIFKGENDNFDLIFCGSKAADTDNGIIGIQLAYLLGISYVGPIVKLEIDATNKKIKASRCVGDFLEVVECSFPVLFSCQRGLNSPSSVMPLPKIIQAKKKRLDVISVSVKVKTSEIIGIEFAPKKERGRLLNGPIDDRVRELCSILKEKAKGV